MVAAPDHVERSLDGLLGTAAKGVPKMTDLAVLQATLDLVVKASNAPGSLHGLVDPNRVVAAGHSAGAGAAYAFASADPRVKAWISYSVGFGGQAGPAPSAPTKPGMVMLGTTDGIIPPAASVKVYAGMHSPKYLVKIAHAGHLVFSDICLIGRSTGGITGIAKAIKLPIPPSLLKLGSDGCTSDHPPVREGVPRDRSAERRVLPVGAPASTRRRSASTRTRSRVSARPSPSSTDSDGATADGRESLTSRASTRRVGRRSAIGKPSRRASPNAITLPSAVAIQ